MSPTAGPTLPDAHHVEKLRRALWSGQAHGKVAVMVGAGMSANAEPLEPGAGPMPVFSSLATQMSAELLDKAPNEVPPAHDPIGVASDYESIFGTHALDDFLRRAIDDAAYRPARIHRLLMSLPWSDVYTTNYDTLLERAATSVIDRNYPVVATQESLVGTLRPRLVKLHGSFPDHRPFIITREHYRQYPITHAALVNTVQQAVMECSLCLLGFGGNDPNFLAWAGWVHDNLGDSAPPIYLVGVLDLNTRQRTLLEAQRVIPIDLGPAFPSSQYTDPGSRHRKANEWFLLNLACGEPDPAQWPYLAPRRASGQLEFDGWDIPLLGDAVQEDQSTALERLSRVMQRFPGWLTCPPDRDFLLRTLPGDGREELNEALSGDAPSAALGAWDLITEIYSLRRQLLDDEDLQMLRVLLEQEHDAPDRWFRVALRYLTHLRWTSRWDDHEEWAGRLATAARGRTEYRALLCREAAQRALDQLDLVALEEALEAWPRERGLFRLELARASFLAEQSQAEAGARIARDVLISIRSGQRGKGGSIAAYALEGTAMALLQLVAFDLPRELARHDAPYGRHAELTLWECEPRRYFEAAENSVATAPAQSVGVRKTFDVGSVQITRNMVLGRDPSAAYRAHAISALMLFESFGLPFRSGVSLFFQDLAIRAATIIASDQPERAFSVLLRANAGDAVEQTCTRLFVARLTSEQVERLRVLALRVVAPARANSRKKEAFAHNEHRRAAALELLSRLCHRFAPPQAEQLFVTAVEMTSSPDFHSRFVLAGGVRHSIKRCFDAADEATRLDWMERLLDVPVVHPNSVAVSTSSWVDPFISLALPTAPRDRLVAWDHHVEVLLASGHDPDHERRIAALWRLVALHLSKNLCEAHAQRLGELLWSRVDTVGLPVGMLHIYRPAALIKFPNAPSDLAARLRGLLLHKLFPDTTGVPGSQRNAQERTAHTSFAGLGQLLESYDAPLTPAEAASVVKRASIWLAKHQSRTRHEELRMPPGTISDALLTAMVDFMAEHVLPVLMNASGLPLKALLEALAVEPVSTARWAYDLQRLKISSRADAERALLASIRAPLDISATSTVKGALRWWTQEDDAPAALKHELMDAVRRPGRRSFASVAHTMAYFLDEHFEVLLPTDIDHLVSTVVTLQVETNVSDPAQDCLYDDPMWMPDARIAAIHMAAVVYRRSPIHRPRLDPWITAIEGDEHLEGARVWRAVVDGDSGAESERDRGDEWPAG